YATKRTQMISNRFTFQDDATWTKGGHSIQFGGQIERFQLNSRKPNRASGVWTFPSLQAFLSGTCDVLLANLQALRQSDPSATLPSPRSACGFTPALSGSGAITSSVTCPSCTTESGYRGAPPSSVLQGVAPVVSLIGGTVPNGFDTFNRG